MDNNADGQKPTTVENIVGMAVEKEVRRVRKIRETMGDQIYAHEVGTLVVGCQFEMIDAAPGEKEKNQGILRAFQEDVKTISADPLLSQSFVKGVREEFANRGI